MNLNINKLEKKLNLSIRNKNLFVQALTHKSSNPKINNEKLEFLGDRVIGLILSKKLFDLYPTVNEGILDKRFAKLVNKNTCAKIFWSIDACDLIILGDSSKKIKKKDEKILSDTCEALIGAIYLEKGYNFTEKYVLNLWKKEITKSNVTLIDSKSELQEYSLKLYKTLPIYKKEHSSGPQHSPLFSVSVKINAFKKFTAKGSSIKIAQQNAAKKLLIYINNK